MRENSPRTIEKDISSKLFLVFENAYRSPMNSNNFSNFLAIGKIFLSLGEEYQIEIFNVSGFFVNFAALISDL
jgi:hypothetical protein